MVMKGLLEAFMRSVVSKRPVIQPLEHAQLDSKQLDSHGTKLQSWIQRSAYKMRKPMSRTFLVCSMTS